MDWQEDMVSRRKPSQKKPPKKARHKHHYQDCILAYMCKYGQLSPENGFQPRIVNVPATYCTICGKIGDVNLFYDLFHECKADLPQNLPEFHITDVYKDSHVNLEEVRQWQYTKTTELSENKE